MPKYGQPEEVWKEYHTGGGSDNVDPGEERRERVHGVGEGFYDGVQNTSNDPRQVVESPGYRENFTR